MRRCCLRESRRVKQRPQWEQVREGATLPPRLGLGHHHPCNTQKPRQHRHAPATLLCFTAPSYCLRSPLLWLSTTQLYFTHHKNIASSLSYCYCVSISTTISSHFMVAVIPDALLSSAFFFSTSVKSKYIVWNDHWALLLPSFNCSCEAEQPLRRW